MEDTPNNRKKLEKAIERMEAEMLLGVFDYAKYFPKSARLAEIKAAENQINAVSSKAPVFSKYCEIWVADKEIEWRSSYAEKIRIVIRKYLTPYFGTISVINIKKSDILGFRSSLAKVTYGNNQEHHSLTLHGYGSHDVASRYFSIEGHRFHWCAYP